MLMKNYVQRAAASLIVIVCATPASAGSNVLFILDGSGSMWERVDGQPKIVLAKKALDDVLREFPAETKMGLMTYGVHRKGDCGDITLLSPVGAQGADQISKQVNSITPKGDTPIAGALMKAADAFKGVTGTKTIVLVTDGAEECHADPCAVTKQLAAADINLRVNIIGFDLASKQRDAVQCIVKEGRGNYYEAKNTKGLSDAMTAVKAVVVAAQTAPPPPLPPVVKQAEHNYGTPIHGGDAFDSAVGLKAATLYHLDYDQAADKQDFFKIAAKSGQQISVTITGGVSNSIQAEVESSQRTRVAGQTMAGPRAKNTLSSTVSYGNDGTYYVLIESAGYGGHVGPDATFQVDLVNLFDANSNRDAGPDQNSALELKPGVYARNYLDGTDDTDTFKVTLPPGKAFQFKTRPSLPGGLMTLTATDSDGVTLQSATAPNAGAVAKLDKLLLPKGGVVFVKVTYSYGGIPGIYSIAIGPGEVASPPTPPSH
ncbi:MAG: VWA domain-containing protein [Proteobacteria bacterium]|nr:VWA domain-containing protein [Pseudomonadota bacterium]